MSKVLFKGKLMLSDRAVQLECNTKQDTYNIKDLGKYLVVTVNDDPICIGKESFEIEVVE